MPTKRAHAKVLRIDISDGPAGLKIATSQDMPRLQVIGLSHDELKSEVPSFLAATYGSCYLPVFPA